MQEYGDETRLAQAEVQIAERSFSEVKIPKSYPIRDWN